MRSAMVKNILLSFVIFLLASHLFASSLAAAQPADIEEQTRAIAADLRCPVCQNLSVADSPSELAQDMRALIEEQLKAGRSPQEIKNFFVSKYGDWVLLAPPAKGFSLLLWVLPAGAALCGFVLVLVALRRWTAKKSIVTAGAAARDPQLTGESRRAFLIGEQSRLEAELKELEFDFQAGKISAIDYAALRGDSEKQAAAVAREVETLPALQPDATDTRRQKLRATGAAESPRSLRNWQLVTGAVFLLSLGLALGVLLTRSLRPRGSEDTVTGDFLTGTDPARSREAMLAQGRAAIEKGDFAQAIDAFKKVLAADPNNPEAHAYMGLLLSQAGHSEGALMAFDRALAADPNFPLALWGKGMLIYRTGGDPAEARRLLEKVAGIMPAGPDKSDVEKVLVELARPGAVKQSPAAEKSPPAPVKPEASAQTAAADIQGVIDVDGNAKGKIDRRAVLFIIAKSSQQAGGPPLAVKKIAAPKFPLTYSLGAKDVMMPGAVFSGKLYISARLDKDGNPLTKDPEDLSGQYNKNPVEVGSKKIDFVLAPVR